MSALRNLRDDGDIFDTADDDADEASANKAGSIADALAWECLRAALPSDLRRRIRRGDPVAVIVQAPGAEWCGPLTRVLRRDSARTLCLSRDGSSRREHDPAKGNDEVAWGLAGGRPVIGVSQDPQSLLPSALLSAADARISVAPPDADILRRLLRKHARGKAPAEIPNGAELALTFAETVSAFRAGASSRDVVANLLRAAESKKANAGAVAADVPPLDCLPADLRRLAQDIASGVSDYRAGRIRWRDVPTTGVLLAGPPGAGKTTFASVLARALVAPLVADSCGKMFARSGDAGHLGTIARAMQDAFDAARAAAATVGVSVLCLDEFDAACPDRASMDRRARDFWAPIVTLVLTLLENHEGVIIVAATNCGEVIDAAATRPGRLRRVDVGPPGAESLMRVLRWRLGGALSTVADVNLLSALRLAGPAATPAQAADWARDLLQAAREARREPTLDDLLRIIAPPDDRTSTDRRVAAIHEAGHCVAYREAGMPIASASIIPRGASGGETRAAGRRPEFPTRADLDAGVMILLAGRAAEEAILGAASTGAVADLAVATRALAEGHAAHGLGATLLHRSDAAGSLAYDRDLRDIVEADLSRLYAQSLALMRRRRADVERLAEALLVRRFLTGEDIAALVTTSGGRGRSPKTRGRDA
ncbi:ATP-dependent+zinc+metalloprotease+FtsH [Methylocapsa aurea]|uniref:AAA family ATPase n=1 Tax=Methylocapsa aurea TaxID=663610 RepID=UPI003D188375